MNEHNTDDRRKRRIRVSRDKERRSGEDRRSPERNIAEQRAGESLDDYIERIVSAAPPPSDKAKIVIREAADEYWRDRDSEP